MGQAKDLTESDYGKLSPAWEAEIQRRLRMEDAAESLPADDVFRELEAELRARR